MKSICIRLVALSIAVLGRLGAEDTNSTVPQVPVKHVQEDSVKRDFFRIKVTLESAGKEESSYLAYCSEDSLRCGLCAWVLPILGGAGFVTCPGTGFGEDRL
jgi:hypothetical protein